jgi:hypothetical protein
MSRRKIAMALHSLGEEIQPPSSEERQRQSDEARRQRREDIIRQNRLELVRRAREEGVAVDLDELAAIGREIEAPFLDNEPHDSPKTFDEIVGSDGMLRERDITSGQTTGIAGTESEGLRNRGARGLAVGASYANPFEDEAHVLHDEDEELKEALRQSRESSRTLSAEPEQLVDIDGNPQPPSPYKTDDELEAEIQEAIRRSLEEVPPAPLSETEDAASTRVVDDSSTPEMMQTPSDPPASVPGPASMPGSIYESYYYGPHPNLHASGERSFHSTIDEQQPQPPPEIFMHDNDHVDYDMPTPAGSMTPTEDGFSTVGSLAGGATSDVGILAELESALSQQEHQEQQIQLQHDGEMSDTESEAFSLVGASTPGSWTDVESMDGDEEMHDALPQLLQPQAH